MASEEQNGSHHHRGEKMKVVIQPCSDRISAANLEKTIFNGISAGKILEFIPGQNKEDFTRSFPNQVNLWGG